MDKTLGSNHHSGTENPVAKKKKRKRKRKKPKPNGGANGGANGKSDWKEMAEAAQEKIENLELALARQVQTNRELKKRFKVVEKAALDERAAVKLKVLQHLWGTLINFQAKCPEDKKRIEALVSEYAPALKKAVQEASQPL